MSDRLSPADIARLDDIAAELADLGPMALTLRPATVFALCGLLQLASRHPGVGDSGRVTIATFLAGARAYFADCPALLAALDDGDNPALDR